MQLLMGFTAVQMKEVGRVCSSTGVAGHWYGGSFGTMTSKTGRGQQRGTKEVQWQYAMRV